MEALPFLPQMMTIWVYQSQPYDMCMWEGWSVWEHARRWGRKPDRIRRRQTPAHHAGRLFRRKIADTLKLSTLRALFSQEIIEKIHGGDLIENEGFENKKLGLQSSK